MPMPTAQDAMSIIGGYNATANQALIDNANTINRNIALNNQDLMNRSALNNVDTKGKLAQNALDKSTIDQKLQTNNRQIPLLQGLYMNQVGQHDALKQLLGAQTQGANQTYDIAGRQFTSDTADANRLAGNQRRDLTWQTMANGGLQTQGYGMHRNDINSALAKQLGDYGRGYEGAGVTHNQSLASLANQGTNADFSLDNYRKQYQENLAGTQDTAANLFTQMLGLNNAADSINRTAPLNNALLTNQAQSTNANLQQSLSNNQANYTGQLAGQALTGINTGAMPAQVNPVKKPAGSNLFGFKKV